VLHGGPFDRWDLVVRGGLLASAHILSVAEEHGAGKQMVRFSIRPHWTLALIVPVLALLALDAAALGTGAIGVGVGILLLLLVLAGRGIWEAGVATGAARAACASMTDESTGQEQPLLTSETTSTL
jgi:hypothetical protein